MSTNKMKNIKKATFWTKHNRKIYIIHPTLIQLPTYISNGINAWLNEIRKIVKIHWAMLHWSYYRIFSISNGFLTHCISLGFSFIGSFLDNSMVFRRLLVFLFTMYKTTHLMHTIKLYVCELSYMSYVWQQSAVVWSDNVHCAPSMG